MLAAQLAQARGPHLLAHLDQKPDVEAKPSARGEHGGERRQVDAVLALVVGDPAAVKAAVRFDQLPGRQALPPARIEPSDDIAVPVAEDARQSLALDPFSK
jgi:hypothetical protein